MQSKRNKMILSHIYDVLIRCLFPHVSNRMELRKKHEDNPEMLKVIDGYDKHVQEIKSKFKS